MKTGKIVLIALICAVAMPVLAAETARDRNKPSLEKAIKKLIVRVFGEGLTVPKP